MKLLGLFITLALGTLGAAIAEEPTPLPETRTFKVLDVEISECDSEPCLRFTILCKRNFYHGRIAGLLLRATWYAHNGSRVKTTVNDGGSCGLGGDLTQTHLLIPQRRSGFTYTIEPIYK